MLNWAFWGTLVAAVIFAGFCELRRSWREASRTALRVAMTTTTAQAPFPSNEDCEDAVMADVLDDQIKAASAAFNPDPFTRDDPPRNLAWPPVPEVEFADFALWKAELQAREEER